MVNTELASNSPYRGFFQKSAEDKASYARILSLNTSLGPSSHASTKEKNYGY